MEGRRRGVCCLVLFVAGVAEGAGIAERARGYLIRTYEDALGSGPEALSLVHTTHAYWLLGALHLVNAHERVRAADLLPLLQQRRHVDGGFGATPDGEASALHTLAALQLAALLGQLDAFRADAELLAYAKAQLSAAVGADGCDARQACCAILALRLVGAAPAVGSADARALRDAILRCRNWDGGFGGVPLAESHAGTTFCCVAALGALGELDALVRPEDTARWLAERQQPCGGFNGRADKAADLCYSWWCTASLSLLSRLHWVDASAALRFIDACAQADGGLAHAPGEPADPYHTFFGFAARALLLGAVADAEGRPEAAPAVECALALPRAVVPEDCRL